MKSSHRQPVFLLGAGRSGTKFVRSLLSASKDVNSIPFDVGYVWRYGNESVPHDELTPDMASDKVVRYVRKTLPQLADETNPAARFFLEKSVPNTLRPAFIHRIFPQAKFIHLIRDGRAVTESAMRLWQEPPEAKYLLQKLKYFPWSNYRYAFWYLRNQMLGKLSSGRAQQIWGPRYRGIYEDLEVLPLETVCARQWRRCVEVCAQQLSTLDVASIFETRYEQLMTDESELIKMCNFIGLQDSEDVVKRFKSTANPTNLKKWQVNLSDEQLENILTEIAPLLVSLGYGELS